jgi:hypothetical protein
MGGMERRSERRYQHQRPVTVTVLGDNKLTVTAAMSNLSGKGMQLATAVPLPYNAAVQVYWDDVLALGEVVYCRRTDLGYTTGVELEQALTNLEELTRLSRALEGGAALPVQQQR